MSQRNTADIPPLPPGTIFTRLPNGLPVGREGLRVIVREDHSAPVWR